MMMKALVWFLLFFVIQSTLSGSPKISCKLIEIDGGSMVLEMRNLSPSNIVIQYGDDGEFIRVGAAYLYQGSMMMSTAGRFGSRWDSPAYLLLFPGHRISIRKKLPNVRKGAEILQLVVGVEFLVYEELVAKTAQKKPQGFDWNQFVDPIIYNKSALEKLHVSYGLSLGLGGHISSKPDH